MIKIAQILWGIFLFVFPFSVRFLLHEDAAYRFGQFNPWVSEFFYLPEIFLVSAFILWLIYQVRHRKITLGIFDGWAILELFLLNAVVVSFLSGTGALSLFLVWRLLEVSMVYALIRHELLPIKRAVQILLGGFLLQLLWGFIQWRLNNGLGLKWLGENIIGPDVKGVAKLDLPDGSKQIRAYGSFLHPNILAAYLTVVFFIGWDFLKAHARLFWFALLALGLYVTHSRTAMVAATTGLALLMFFAFAKTRGRRSITLLFLVGLVGLNIIMWVSPDYVAFKELALQERGVQIEITRDMLTENPWGVGTRGFTLAMERYADRILLPWEFQPVHNTYFLLMAEVGLQGFLIFLLGALYLWFRKKPEPYVPLLVILLMATMDHFWWDSFAGLVLLGLVAGMYRLRSIG